MSALRIVGANGPDHRGVYCWNRGRGIADQRDFYAQFASGLDSIALVVSDARLSEKGEICKRLGRSSGEDNWSDNSCGNRLGALRLVPKVVGLMSYALGFGHSLIVSFHNPLKWPARG